MIIFSGIIHLFVGVLLGALFFPSYSIIFIAIGSLLPDCDTRKSFAGKILPLWIFFKHRGFIHKIWGLLIFSFLLGYFTNINYGISLAIGYFIHLFLDSLTPARIKWF